MCRFHSSVCVSIGLISSLKGGWGTDKEFKDMKLATPVSEGWLFSKDDETVRIFAGYDVESDGSIHFFGEVCFSELLV